SDGRLAGSSLTMNTAIRNVVEECGVDPHLAIQAATSMPTRLLGLVDRGSIAVGQRADLVALDRQFAVQHTWIGGQLVFSRH
ncbi:MAG: amidohydrolase family protein, partial [Ilumatobacteraceae bacterium]